MSRPDLEVERRYFDRLIEEQGEFDPLSDRAWTVLAGLFSRAVEGERVEVLDVGCGTGRSRAVYVEHAERYVGMDLALNALRLARNRIPRGAWLQADALALPFAGESFDVVAFSSVLHHLTARRPALREALRVLRPNGLIFAFDPNLLHPPMAIFRHPKSPLYSSRGVSPLERPLLGRELRRDFAAAGCRAISQKAQSGLRYRSVAPPLLNSGLALYHACDGLLEASGLGRWLGAFLVTMGRRPTS